MDEGKNAAYFVFIFLFFFFLIFIIRKSHGSKRAGKQIGNHFFSFDCLRHKSSESCLWALQSAGLTARPFFTKLGCFQDGEESCDHESFISHSWQVPVKKNKKSALHNNNRVD